MEWELGKSGSRRKELRKLDLDNVANVTLFIAEFIGIWQIVFLLNVWPKVALPSPAMVSGTFEELIQDMTLIYGIAVTMYRLVIGFSISIIIGIGIGLAMVKFSGFGKTMSSFAVGLQSFPSVAWVPFAILLIGLNDFAILFVVIMSSVFSVMMSTYSGVRNIPHIYIRAPEIWGQRVFHFSGTL